MPAGSADFRVQINGENNTKEAFSSVQDSVKQLAGFIGAYAGFGKLKDGVMEVLDASNQTTSAMAGLASVSRSFGQDQELVNQAVKSFTSDGLVGLTDAAAGFKNLLASGFNLDETIQLMNGLKDQASFNRQGFYDMGGAVKATTEGIKNGNSVLADATGTTKNLSVMVKDAGIGIDRMGSASTDTAVRQAILNGFLTETGRSAGDAAKASGTLAGEQAKLATTVFTVKAQMGQLLGAGISPIIHGMNQWISMNPELTAALGIAAGGALVMTGLVYGLVTAMSALTLATVVSVGLLSVFGLLMGGAIFKAVRDVQAKMKENTGTMTAAGGATKELTDNTGKLTKAQQDLAEKLADIDKQMKQEARTFKESLADMIRSHQEKVKELESQIKEEDDAFAASQDERLRKQRETLAAMNLDHQRFLDDNKKSLDEEEKRHLEKNAKLLQDYTEKINLERMAGTEVSALKVADLEQQLATELSEEKATHEEKLAELQLRLSRENEDYNIRSTQLAETNARDTQKESEEHTKRVTEYQTKLGEEKSLLDRHAADVESVRNVVLLDEIDKLKRGHDEAVAGYEDQKKKAIKNAQDTSTDLNGINTQRIEESKVAGNAMGEAMGKYFKDALVGAIKGLPRDFVGAIASGFDVVGGWADSAAEKITGKKNPNPLPTMSQTLDSLWPRRAKGGMVQAGNTYRVNEEGEEYFTPATDGYISPHGQGGGGSININIQGDLVVDSEDRKNQLINEIAFLLGRQGAQVINGTL